ncbi:outer membrane protein [Leptospira ryugenii]|uniref:Outer membrane protein n=1 Tax=Leptospira ryugenii TaxID=1917863 RepID=A0A2P2DXH8_9LEPT|nr:outer membrane protein [Leptospira ryugenii]
MSQSSTYYFNYDFSQNFKGVTFGLNLETPRIYSFYLNLGFKHSMLYGNISLNYSIVENARLINFSIYKDNVFTKYFLNEYKIALGYEINESTILSIGLIEQFARISEDRSKLQGYSTEQTIQLRTLFNSFVSFESFANTFISLSRTF